MVDTNHPIWKDDIPPRKDNARAYLPLTLDQPSTLRSLTGQGYYLVYIRSNYGFYYKDTNDTTTADDGASCVRDSIGFAWKFLSFGVGGDLFDAYGHTADKATYNSQAAGFTFFDVDAFSGEGGWYVRISAVAGTWAGPFRFQGPSGQGDRFALHVNFEYRPTDSQVLLDWVPASDEIITFASNFEPSRADFGLGSFGTVFFLITKDGTEVGRCTVSSPSNTVGVFTSSGGAAVVFSGALNNRLQFLAPSTQDASLAQGSITIIGSR